MAQRATTTRKAPPAPAKVSTITLKMLATDAAGANGFPVRTGTKVITDFLEGVQSALQGGDKVRINGLGIFMVKNRPARMGRNPATGESIKLKASKKINFRPSKELKELVGIKTATRAAAR